MKPFFVSVPHSGELVPSEVPWLEELAVPVLMRDVDRFVDKLYQPAIDELELRSVVAQWHRYVVDLNRLEGDIDCDSVQGAENPTGSFATGLHWRITTRGEKLIPTPMSQELHAILVEKYFRPFHQQVRGEFEYFKKLGYEKVYQLDAHSMPSLGTKAHRDPGRARPEIVISDVDGTSCEPRFLELVVEAYRSSGFQVELNFPYKGGRVTQTYGKPDVGQHTLQVELNRKQYMDEESKELLEHLALDVQRRIQSALSIICRGL